MVGPPFVSVGCWLRKPAEGGPELQFHARRIGTRPLWHCSSDEPLIGKRRVCGRFPILAKRLPRRIQRISPFHRGETPIVNFRRTLASLLFACLASLPAIHAQAAKPAVQELASGSALLIDLKTTEVLYSSNQEMVVPIASVTKLMPAMVVV